MRRSAAGRAAGTTFTLALTGFGIRALARAWTVIRNRTQVARLSELDDRALKDIGLLRSDVAAALSLPWHHDPSNHLAEVAGGGRFDRRSGRPSVVAVQDRAPVRQTQAPAVAPAGRAMPC